MKKIAFITSNNILAESLDATVKAMPIKQFDFFLLLNPHQVFIDIEVLKIDIVLIDMALFDLDLISRNDKNMRCLICEQIHARKPNCKILLLLSQNDSLSRKVAMLAKRDKIIDDFVFYDTSLKYLLAKLSTL